MRCAIYGAGSLGTVRGAYLTKGGQSVELINRNKAHIAGTCREAAGGRTAPCERKHPSV